jgi:hypothetical protein
VTIDRRVNGKAPNACVERGREPHSDNHKKLTSRPSVKRLVGRPPHPSLRQRPPASHWPSLQPPCLASFCLLARPRPRRISATRFRPAARCPLPCRSLQQPHWPPRRRLLAIALGGGSWQRIEVAHRPGDWLLVSDAALTVAVSAGHRLLMADEPGANAQQLKQRASTAPLVSDGGQAAQRPRSPGRRAALRGRMRTALRRLRCNALLDVLRVKYNAVDSSSRWR